MKNFCYSISNEKIKDSFLASILGKGAFQRFKESLERFGMDDDWYKYRENEIKKIAIEFCEEHGIAYI